MSKQVIQKKHPIQPLQKDEDGTIRFKRNAIVDYLLDWAKERGCGLNELARIPFSVEDRQQFAQLIGYSLCGYGDLSYVDSDAYNAAEKMELGLTEQEAKIQTLQEELDNVRDGLRKTIAQLYNIHPDNLRG